MPTKNKLADVSPETLNAMVNDMARELGRPWDVHPDLVDLDADAEEEAGGFNRGCVRDGVTLYREGQEWRRKALAALEENPEWVKQWLAAAEMDRLVEELCRQKGLEFAPHECPPWWVQADDDPTPRDDPPAWAETRPHAIRLRRQLEAEIRKLR